MVEKSRDLVQAVDEWKKRMIRNTDQELIVPFTNTINMFSQKLVKLAGAQEREPLEIEFPSKYGLSSKTSTRLEIDGETASDLRGQYAKYSKGIESAISGMYQSADAQCWGVEMFDRMMSALSEEAKKNTEDLKKLYESYGFKFGSKTEYESLVGSASTLKGIVRKKIKDLPFHLEEVARKELHSDKLRTDS
jgi:hypothetical protein